MKRLLILFIAFSFMFAATGFAQTTLPTSESVLKQAYTQAAKENKKVLLIFHASWCGWCKKMEASLNDPSCKTMFDDNYVIATLDVLERPAKASLENPGSLDVLKKYKGEKSGLPFWLVLDANGKELADSQVRPAGASLDAPGESVGCPASEKEVAFFVGVLKATSKLNDEQLAVIAKRFAQNKPAPVARTAAN
ncbi:thioredoxin family protein [Mucilaginibacter sp. AW1-3]